MKTTVHSILCICAVCSATPTLVDRPAKVIVRRPAPTEKVAPLWSVDNHKTVEIPVSELAQLRAVCKWVA